MNRLIAGDMLDDMQTMLRPLGRDVRPSNRRRRSPLVCLFILLDAKGGVQGTTPGSQAADRAAFGRRRCRTGRAIAHRWARRRRRANPCAQAITVRLVDEDKRTYGARLPGAEDRTTLSEEGLRGPDLPAHGPGRDPRSPTSGSWCVPGRRLTAEGGGWRATASAPQIAGHVGRRSGRHERGDAEPVRALATAISRSTPSTAKPTADRRVRAALRRRR